MKVNVEHFGPFSSVTVIDDKLHCHSIKLRSISLRPFILSVPDIPLINQIKPFIQEHNVDKIYYKTIISKIKKMAYDELLLIALLASR